MAAQAERANKGAQAPLMAQGTQGCTLARHAAAGFHRELPNRLHEVQLICMAQPYNPGRHILFPAMIQPSPA